MIRSRTALDFLAHEKQRMNFELFWKKRDAYLKESLKLLVLKRVVESDLFCYARNWESADARRGSPPLDWNDLRLRLAPQYLDGGIIYLSMECKKDTLLTTKVYIFGLNYKNDSSFFFALLFIKVFLYKLSHYLVVVFFIFLWWCRSCNLVTTFMIMYN